MSLKRRVLHRVVTQFGRPHGWGGYLAGWVMGHRASNRERNRWVVSLLHVQPTDRILEIGFGPGVAVEALSRLATDGIVYGIDHSAVMVHQASRRNRVAVGEGRVELRMASADDLPVFDRPLDTVLAVNSMGFWSDPVSCLEEVRRQLRPGGHIAIGSQPRCPGANSETSRQAAREITAALAAAGFIVTRAEMLPLVPPVACVLAIKGRDDEPVPSK